MSDFDPTKLRLEIDTESIGCRDYLVVRLTYSHEVVASNGWIENREQLLTESKVSLRDLKSRLNEDY